jgi:hypothetical protein
MVAFVAAAENWGVGAEALICEATKRFVARSSEPSSSRAERAVARGSEPSARQAERSGSR